MNHDTFIRLGIIYNDSMKVTSVESYMCKDDGSAFKAKIPDVSVTKTREVAERLTDMGKNRLSTNNDTAKGTTTKRARLLANPDIKRWYDNLARGSKITAEGRLRRLGRFCETHQMTPAELADLAMRDLRAATDLIEDHITAMESKGQSPGYIGEQIKTVKSWLRHFDVEIRRKMKIASSTFTPTLQNERVPDAREIDEIYSRAGLRDSVIISLMAKSGLRPETIGNHDGTDGLRMRDLPDVVIHKGVVRCIRTPIRIVVRRELSKTRHQYFTLATSPASKQLVTYLNDRLASGEPLHGDSAIVAPDHIYKTNRGTNTAKEFLPTNQVSNLIRKVFRPRFSWRPYVLRAYFDTQLLIAESKGKIAHDFRVFFMGHKGTMESRYTTNKGVLPEVLMTEMRDAFARSEEFLDQSDAADPILEQKQSIHQMIEDAAPDQLERVLEALQVPAICTKPGGS